MTQDDSLRRVAVHEAAHMVVANVLDLPHVGARVWRDDGRWRGEVRVNASEGRRADMLTVAAAGSVAESLAFSEPVGDDQDGAQLARLSEADLASHRRRAEGVLTDWWDAVLAFADLLVEGALHRER